MTDDEKVRRCECGKRCLTRGHAEAAARNLNSHQQNDDAPVHAYQCGPWWHTGHVPSRLRKRRKPPTKRRQFGPKPLTPRADLPPELQ